LLRQAEDAAADLDARAVAPPAGRRAGGALDAVAAALGAVLLALVRDLLLDAAVRLFQGQIDDDLDVAAAARPAPAAHVEHVFDEFKYRAAAEVDAAHFRRGRVVAVPVVPPPPVGVAQYAVSFVDFLEMLVRLAVAGV